MKYTIYKGKHPLTLEHDNIPSTINVDELTIINTSNIFGEATVGNAQANRIGLLKAECQEIMDKARLDRKIYESEFKAKVRRDALKNGGKYKMNVEGDVVEIKLTETFIKDCFESDRTWQDLMRKCIESENAYNKMDSLYWSTQNKARTLNSLTGSTTPEEFVAGIVEGNLNGITIKKG